MSHRSPTIEGFRAAFRRLSLVFAEIAWRWSVGATACVLIAFSLLEYLNTLPVSNRDRLLLRTRQPTLIAQVFAHIVRGSLGRVMLSALFLAAALTFLWIIAATLGRAATVRALLDYFRRDVASSVSTGNESVARVSSPANALLGLNFLRTALGLAALLGFLGATILASFASPETDPRPGLVVLLFLPLALLIWLLWETLNWFLSLAAIFAVRDGEDALGALSAAVCFFRDRNGPLLAVGIWFGIAHLTAFVAATTAISFPMSFIAVVPTRIVLAIMLLLTLVYFAVADWLYMSRLASYVCIAEMPDALVAPAPLAISPPQGSGHDTPQTPFEPTTDRDEPILSDIPNLAVET